METEKQYLRVGIFFFSVMGILIWYLMTFGAGTERQSLLRYALYFDTSVAGMTRGAPVRLQGLDIGIVSDIHFVSDKDDRILVIADIEEMSPIRADTLASVAFQGITGTTYLSLDNTESGKQLPRLAAKPGEAYPVIKARPSDLQVVLASAPEVMAKLSRIAEQTEKLLSDNNIQAVQGDIAQVHDVLREATGAMRELKMLARTLREDPSIILRGTDHEGYKVKK